MAATEDEPKEPVPTWEVVYTVAVVFIMFAVLLTDRVGTDCVMLSALTAFYIAGIIDTTEALAGFSSQGLLTVLALFAVAEGVNKTGALHWYVSKMLGQPKTISMAQLRVMVPIACMSGFINDTPLVTVALPSVIQWSKRTQIATRYTLIPLSFAALLGGVCTLIGTSTNLVIAGLLQKKFKDDPFYQNLPLFALGQYGVPVAMVGITYVILATPYLLDRRMLNACVGKIRRNSQHGTSTDTSVDDNTLFDNVLLGAKVTQWSPAADRTVKRSGLRDTGGIYLVRVVRASTGNVHHAVGPDFVLQVGDILYFTGLVDSFGEFCAEHGLEVVTNEDSSIYKNGQEEQQDLDQPLLQQSSNKPKGEATAPTAALLNAPLRSVYEDRIGFTLDSVVDADIHDCLRVIYHMQDAIRGETQAYGLMSQRAGDRIVVTPQDTDDLVVVAIDTADRSGLLLDISKCLSRLQLELHHTEAAVLRGRSLSIWRCTTTETLTLDTESVAGRLAETWSVLQALLARDSGVAAVKQRGLRVVRAVVLHQGRLVNTTAEQIGLTFRQTYKAAIVAIQRNGKSLQSVDGSLANVTLEAGDALVLQVQEDSPLLVPPPAGFYESLSSGDAASGGGSQYLSSFFSGRKSSRDGTSNQSSDQLDIAESGDGAQEAVWKDLRVMMTDVSTYGGGKGEFLTAMIVAPGSHQLSGKSVLQAGIDKLPDVFLVSLERRMHAVDVDTVASFMDAVAIDMNEPLREGDVLWFSCTTASAVGDLRKIPGLMSHEDEEVQKMKLAVPDRRLVQAVVARKGALVGKTVKEVRFRTAYGAAVIAVQREGQRVHDHPGNVKLQAGDVLLLEAGPSFLASKIENDRAFALVAEVKDSAPPRMRMLIPALIITVAAYVCYMFKLSTLLGCAMVAVILMVTLGIISQDEARNAIKWEIYLTIASAFGIGSALVNSGVAAAVASGMVTFGYALNIGQAGILGAIYFATVVISQLVANNAAAALIFPIAMDAAKLTGIDVLLMSYTIMLAASAAFMTPFGYQTNLMVMGPGGYKTADYLIFGTPMQLVLTVVTTIYLVSPMWICWLVTFAVCSALLAMRVTVDARNVKYKKS